MKKERLGTREGVILSLSEEFPLNLKALKYALKIRGVDVTHQAIHKELIRLSNQGVIDKTNEKKYALNKQWIEQKNQFFSLTSTRYSGKNGNPGNIIKNAERGIVQCLTFENIVDLDEYFFNFFKELPPAKYPVVMYYKHNWYPFLYAGRERKLMNVVGELYGVCGSKSPIDRIATKQENLTGLKVRIAPGTSQTWNTYVYNNNIIQISHDPTTLRKLEKLYASPKIKNPQFLKSLLEIVHRKGTIRVVIFCDAGVAQQFRTTTKTIFSSYNP